jgi:antitoxin (DNA-binding transcriptional repressor) of toxin-antitoxin stability system
VAPSHSPHPERKVVFQPVANQSFSPAATKETIPAFDAKTRLSELLDRAAQGESFLITKHGRPVGRLGTPDTHRDPRTLSAAVRRLRGFRGTLGDLSAADLVALVHEGHAR